MSRSSRSMPGLLVAVLTLAGCGTALAPPTANSVAPFGSRAAAAPAAKAPKPAKPHPAGTVSVVNFATVDANLYRGGVPADTDLAALQSTYGIKTDIDLQDATSPTEGPVVAHEKLAAEKLGLNFVSLPLPWGVAPPDAMLKTFFETTSNKALLPAYIHCHFGRDRTGTMVAAYQMTYHAYTNDQALAQMLTFGYNPKSFPWYTSFVQTYQATPLPLPVR